MTNDRITVSRELLRQTIDLLDDMLAPGATFSTASLRAALEQPAVEPVAWTWDTPAHHFGKGVVSAHFQFDKPKFEGGMLNLRPLYESPPPPADVPLLSDEEICALVREASKGGAINRDGSTSQRIARAIEQAVRRNAGLK